MSKTAGEAIRLAMLRQSFPKLKFVAELQFHESRKWRFDFASEVAMIAVEIEGGTRQGGRHNRHAGYREDTKKYNAATVRGWRVLRYIPSDFDNGFALDDIAETLKRDNERRTDP